MDVLGKKNRNATNCTDCTDIPKLNCPNPYTCLTHTQNISHTNTTLLFLDATAIIGHNCYGWLLVHCAGTDLAAGGGHLTNALLERFCSEVLVTDGWTQSDRRSHDAVDLSQ